MTPVLAAGGSVGASVLADNGKPLAGVAVSLDGADVHQAAKTSGDGRFTFANVPPGRYRLSFTLRGYAPVVLRNVTVEGAPLHLRAIVMHPSLTVIGSAVARERLPFNTTPAALKVFPREAYRDQGQASLATVLDQTPGALVARSSADQSAQPMSPYYGTVRGGLPWETATLID
ncbi:MAG TPA: carboxypeptidase-like regulatory domain-containing protein, partial [Candidatus Baltobacteraceae bacterium]|nr:carboxypeptidase-like regulatory domain-containing protein [Candidatus Baltobacteraceae bacterium]